MDPSAATLTSQGMGYAPIAQGYQHHRRFPTDGLPFMQGPLGGVAAMGVTPYVSRMMGDVGMTPMGIGHDQNVYDRLMNQRFTMMQMQAMQQAASADRDNYFKTFRGMAAVSGTPFGAEQRRAAMSLANSATSFSPLAAEMMPEFLDQMGGLRGSATVMARRMIDAGRYRIDPVTGRMGMSAETVGAQSRDLYGHFYSDQNLPGMKGITAGQTGSLIDQLQMRGMISTAASEGRYAGIRGDDPRAATFRAMQEMSPLQIQQAAKNQKVDLGKPGGLDGNDLDKLNLDPNVAAKLRSFDTDRIKRSVKSYVDVVAAMRDIFGDMGKPNAPMAELVAGVQALTMGGMGQIDPGRMSMMVRQTYNLAKQTGVSMDNVMMMQQHAAQRAGAMGIEPTFGVQATQGGLAFGGAYRAQGHGAHVAWGAFNADQVQQLDTNLRVQASSSNLANRMAVAQRISEVSGGFDPNSDAGRYAAAVRAGSEDWRDAAGNVRSVMMSDRDFTQMMTGAKGKDGRGLGISAGDVQTLLGQRDTNREYVERFNIGNTVRRVQGRDELHPFVGHRMEETLAARFREQLISSGMSQTEAAKRAREVAAQVGQRVTKKMFDMSTEEFSDTNTRNRLIAGFIGEELDLNGMGDVLKGLDPAQREQFLGQTADRFYGATNRAIKGSMYRSFGNLQNVHRLTNRTTLDESDRQQMQARFTAEMQEAMSPLGHGTMLQRAVDALQHVRPDDPDAQLEVLAQALGGVRIEDINRTMMPEFRKIQAKRKEVEELQQRISATSSPEERAGLMEKLDVVRRELGAQATHLAKTGEQFGLFAADTLTHKDLTRALGSSRRLMVTQNDTVGIRGQFGWDVSAENIAAFKAGFGKGDPNNPMTAPLSPEEQMAIEAGRRQKDVDQMRAVVYGEKGATPLSAGQQAAFEKAKAELRKAPNMGVMPEDALNKATVEYMQSQVTNIDPRTVGGVKAESDDDFRVLIRSRRRMLPYRADADAVAALRKQFPQLTEEEATDIANTRIRAARLGIDEGQVEKLRKDSPNKYQGPYGEVDAIADIMASKADQQFVVTDAQIAELAGSKGYVDPTKAMIDKFRDDNKMAGADDAAVKKEMQRRMIMAGRQRASRQRWDEYWGSMEGASAREAADYAFQDMETVADKLVASPQMVQRLGSRAIEISDSLRGDQQRLREMAAQYSGGDVTRLMLRDFSNFDWRKPGAAEDMQKLNAEITQIQQRQRNMLAELGSTEGGMGRKFQLGDDYTQRKRVLDGAVARGEIKKEEADAILASGVGPGMDAVIQAKRRDMGSEARARELLDIDAKATNLSDLQRAAIAGVRFGAGSEEEARLLYGQEKWDAMGPAERNALLAQMQKGTGLGNREQAAKLLGITQEMLDNDKTGDLAKKISAVEVGLATDAHAQQILRPLPPKTDTETDAQFAERKAKYDKIVRQVRLGRYSPEVAKEELGLPKDLLDDPKYRHIAVEVDRQKVLWGNEQEAMRLLGFKPGQKLTADQQKQLDQLKYDVGVARKLSTTDEGLLASYEGKQALMEQMEARRGFQPGQLELIASEGGDGWKQTDEQKKRLADAQRDAAVADRNTNAAKTRAANLRSQIAAMEKAGVPDAKKYNDAKEALKAAEGDVKKFEGQKAEVLGRIQSDAFHFDQAPEEYLKGKGFVTDADLKAYRGLMGDRDADKAKLEQIAKGMGLKVEDLAGATNVSKRLLERQKKAAARMNMNSTDLVKEVMQAYGFKPGDRPDEFDTEFAKLIDGTAGKGTAHRMIDTRRLIDDASKDKGGRAALLKDFKDAGTDAAKLKAFREKYGVTGDEEFNALRGAIEFQEKSGLSQIDGLGGRAEKSKMGKMYAKWMEGGDQKPGVPTPYGMGTPQKIEMSGRVKIEGDTLDFAGAWGGGRNYTPGVP